MNEKEQAIGGYDYGSADIGRSPVSLDELALLERTVALTVKGARLEYHNTATLT